MQYRLCDGDQVVVEQVCGQFFVPVADWVSRVQLLSVRVWVNVSPEQTDEVDGVQFWYVQDWQFFVPVMVRVPVEQSLFVRACSKLFPWQMLLAAGAQPVAVQVGGQYLLPLALLVSVVQSDRVRDCVNTCPVHSVPGTGDQVVGVH